MNVFSERGRGWRKGRKRGVSPIIATILLVAITVVLAAVLYVLVSGLTHSGASTPYSLGPSSPSASVPAAGVNWISITLNPTTGLTTGMFGLSLANLNSIGIGVGTAAVATCKAGAALTAANCGAPATGNWYAALSYLSNGTVANVYSGGAWTGPTVPVSAAMQLMFVSGATSYSGTGDQLSAFSTGSSSVSGSVSL
jgi:flagellin-like protein